MKPHLQLLEVQLKDRSSCKLHAVSGGEAYTNRPSNRGLCIGIVLILLSLEIVPIQLSPAIAAESTADVQFDPDDPSFHQLVAPCLDCHSINDVSADRVGPTLKNIVGRRAASIRSYKYSAALYQKEAVGLIWDEDTLDRFLQSPQSMAPGNAMTFAGIPDANDRAKLVAWLASGPARLPNEVLVASPLLYIPEVRAVLLTKADTEYGEFLAGKCLTCHFTPGASGSIPPISGLPAEYFINALLEYQQGKRPNRVMQVMSEPLGTKELASLADFFERHAP